MVEEQRRLYPQRARTVEVWAQDEAYRYTPELSAAEPVVPLLREAVADESFPSLEALQERLVEQWVYLQEHPEVIRGVAGFRWIPDGRLSI